MKYEEFKEIILQLNIKELELDKIVEKTYVMRNHELKAFNSELNLLVQHLRNLANNFETRVNFEISKFCILKMEQKKLSREDLKREIDD